MFKLYELTEGQSHWASKLLLTGVRGVLGPQMNHLYNVLKSRTGARVRTIYALYDVNGTLVSATGAR